MKKLPIISSDPVENIINLGRTAEEIEADYLNKQREEKERLKDNNPGKPKKVAQNGNKSHTKAEKKDYRINLALTSPLGEKIKQQAWKEHKSVNSFIEELIIKQLNS